MYATISPYCTYMGVAKQYCIPAGRPPAGRLPAGQQSAPRAPSTLEYLAVLVRHVGSQPWQSGRVVQLVLHVPTLLCHYGHLKPFNTRLSSCNSSGTIAHSWREIWLLLILAWPVLAWPAPGLAWPVLLPLTASSTQLSSARSQY